MQVQHKATVHVPAHHQADDAIAASGIAFGEAIAPYVLFGAMLFGAFVMFRIFRWFLRVTR
jgi:hypothetical protein